MNIPTDSEMLDWLEREAHEKGGLLLHSEPKPTGRRGLGLGNTGRPLRKAIAEAMGAPEPPKENSYDRKHPSHTTRFSDASTFDEVCVNCGATDIVPGGWGKLAEPCPYEPPKENSQDDQP